MVGRAHHHDVHADLLLAEQPEQPQRRHRGHLRRLQAPPAGRQRAAVWEELLARPDFVEAVRRTDILLAPHHGRESGFCPALFDYIKPRLTVVSDGRFGDTSATARYVGVTQGWTVYHRRDGTSEQRKCLTTRHDGVIVVKCGYSPGNRTYLNVTIE